MQRVVDLKNDDACKSSRAESDIFFNYYAFLNFYFYSAGLFDYTAKTKCLLKSNLE
jgi:hypothetical protein